MQFLNRQQRGNGSWELYTDLAGMEGGPTSLALLGLLNSGVPAKDPVVAKGLQYLRGLKPPTTYVRALQTMVFAEAGQNEDRERIAENVKWLIDARVIRDGQFFGWSYSTSPGRLGDNSNSQYALLGLYAGKQGGAVISREIWQAIRDFYIRSQERDGSFIYQPGARGAEGAGSLTMTTAGLSGLLIAGMELNAGREGPLDADGSAPNCGVYDENKPAVMALQWTAAKFRLDLPQRVFYNMYGIERIGRLSGLRFIGRHDWYREGCQYLVETQRDDGSWPAEIGHFDKWPVVCTSFGLLFLSKGRTPVLISKLVHTDSWPRLPGDLDWNNDRNDLKHMTEFASRELFKKQPLAWQIFDIMRAADAMPEDEVISDMLQSPIAYINGHFSPKRRFTAQEKKLLKQYVENGGFILAEACCSRQEFDLGFKQLAAELWPDNPLEELPGNHPVWTAFPGFNISPGQPYKLMGIQMGCKTVVIYSPQDLSCQWESNEFDGRARTAFRLGANIIAYATGLEPPKPRLTEVAVASDKDDPRTIPRGYFRVAQLKFQGDYKPAPRAMRNLMDHMRKFAALDVVLKTEEMQVFSPNIRDFKFLYLHGRGKFRFAQEEMENLRFNLENGGLLLADACCGQVMFDASFREFVKELYPKQNLERIPLDDVIFSKELNGEAITADNTRGRQEKNGQPRNMPPWLEGIKIDGRWAVIYSKYDIGCALERHQSSDCIGYVPESALRLASAAVLYTLRP